MKKTKKEYCGLCGKLLEERKAVPCSEFWGTQKYDRSTGKKRMIKIMACPRYKDINDPFSFLSDGFMHDAHSIGKEFLI